MDEKENEIKNTNEKSNRNRRSSILKLSKFQNEGNPTTRRVSFSSNFIKTFTTDGDKNTIWDTTVEEPLSVGESSRSYEKRDYEDYDMNTTSIYDLVNSSNDYSDVQLDASKLTSELNKSATMEFTCMNASINTNRQERTSKMNSSATMDFTCTNPLSKNHNESKTKIDNFTTMEFTCINPPPGREENLNFNIDIDESKTKSDNSSTMEFTCINPYLNEEKNRNIIINHEEPETKMDNSSTMEFTCINPAFNKGKNPNSIINHEEREIKMDNSTTMEFTCVNPVLNKENNADFVINNEETEIKMDNSTTMEFTCVNPALSKEKNANFVIYHKEPEIKMDNSTTMEFTCVNPALNKEKNANFVISENHEEPKIRVDNSTTMEFTCVNPAPSKGKNTSFVTNNEEPEIKMDNSITMEFTCVNPALNKENNANLVINPEVPEKKMDNYTTMEFTCVNPATNKENNTNFVINHEEPAIKGDSYTTMEFTCVNPALSKEKNGNFFINYKEAETKMDNSTTMKFTCVNPALNKEQSASSVINHEEPKIRMDNSTTMEFTCVNPALNKEKSASSAINHEEPKIRMDNSTTMEFTCVNPAVSKKENAKLVINHKEPELKMDICATMECISVSPAPNKEKNAIKVDSYTTMEFTCVNPAFSKEKDPNLVINLDGSKMMEFSHLNLPQNKNCEGPASKLNNSATMEFTCTNPLHNKNDERPESKLKSSTTMEFAKPMSSVYKLENNGTIPSDGIPIDLEVSIKPKELSTFDFSIRNNADTTNVSNISAFNISKGISLIKNVPKHQLNESSNMSVQSYRVDLPHLDLSDHSRLEEQSIDVSVQTKMWKEKRVDLSSINAVHKDFQHSEAAIPLKADDVEQEESVLAKKLCNSEFLCRSYMNRTDASNISALDISKGISLVKTVHGSSTHEFSSNSIGMNEEHIVDLPQLNSSNYKEISLRLPPPLSKTLEHQKDDSLSSIKVSQIPKISKINHKKRHPPSAELSCIENPISHVDTSKVNAGDLQNKSNTDLSNSGLCNMDDTQQLLRDALRLNNTFNDNLSKIQMNHTYIVEMDKMHSISKEGGDEDDQRAYESSSYTENIGSNTNPNEKQEKEEGCALNQDIDNVNMKRKEEAAENQDLSPISNTEFTGDHYILDKSEIDLVENSADESLLSVVAEQPMDKSVITMNSCQNEQCSETYRESAAVNTESVAKNDITAAEIRAFQELDNEKFISDLKKIDMPKIERYNAPTAYAKELEAQIKQIRESVMEQFEVFKNKLDDVVEYCKNNQFVPDHSDDDEDLYAENNMELPIRRGLVEEIKDKSERCDQSWKMIKVENGVAEFTTFCDKIELILEYSPKDYLVGSLKTRSVPSDGKTSRGKLLEKEFLRLLSPAYMNNSIGSHYTILSLLDYLQIAMDKIKAFYSVLKGLEKSYGLKINDEYIGKFTVLDTCLVIKWDFTIDLSDLGNITKDSVVLYADIGKIDTKDVLNMVEECPNGLEFLGTYITKVQEYLEVLRKRKRSIQLKKIGRTL